MCKNTHFEKPYTSLFWGRNFTKGKGAFILGVRDSRVQSRNTMLAI